MECDFKVVLMVASFRYNNTGMGGHFYSVQSIFREMSKHHISVKLLVIGDLKPEAIDFSKKEVSFFQVNRNFKKKDIQTLHDVILKKKVQVIHCFDTYAFLFARILKSISPLRVVSTKTGGPRPAFHYYPRIRPDTVFSPQEVVYFKKRSLLFNFSKPRLLPNRVTTSSTTSFMSSPPCLPSTSNPKTIKIIRIARICRAYEESIAQSFSLSRKLREKGFEACLFIIGFIQDPSVFERIKSMQTSFDHILTDTRYTRNAARYLNEVDIVVATGRGVMEACQSGKIICCSAKGSELPYLMNKHSFKHFFYYNFSPRPGILAGSNRSEEIIENISVLLTDKQSLHDYVSNLKGIYSKYFDASKVMSDYIDLYQVKEHRLNPLLEKIDLGIHRYLSWSKLKGRQWQHSVKRLKIN